MEALTTVSGLDQDRLSTHAHYTLFHTTDFECQTVANIDTTGTAAAVILEPRAASHDGYPTVGVANETQNLWLFRNPASFTWNLAPQLADPSQQDNPQPPPYPGDPVAVLYDSHTPYKTRIRMKVDSRYQPSISLKRAW